jgi:hypothetical protein
MASQAMQTLRAPMLYTFKRKHFRKADYRSVRHDTYEFDVVAEFVLGKQVGAAATRLAN